MSNTQPDQSEELDWEAISLSLEGHPDAARRLRRVVDQYHQIRRHRPESVKEAFQWRHLKVFDSLGAGNFGQVYRAYDPHLRRYVALKLLTREPGIAGWLDEARLLARVRHPNVIAIHGAEQEGDTGGIWMDLIEGISADDLIEDTAPSIEASHALVVSLAQALGEMHDGGLVHGDVKGSNVMIEANGHVTLLDFGAARDLRKASTLRAASPLSAAPEVVNGEPAEPAADIFSLGVLLVRLMTGRYPFSAESLDQLAQRHQAPPELHGIPATYRSLVLDMMAASPKQRPSADEVCQRLDAIARMPERRRRRRSLLLAFGGLASMLSAALIGWQVSEHAREKTEQAGQRSHAALTFLQDVLGASLTGRFGKDARVVDVLEDARERLNPAINADPFVAASIEYTVGGAYLEIGRESEGLALVESSLQRLQDMSNPPPQALARVNNRLALSLCELELPDRQAELEPQLAAARAAAEVFPPDNPAHRGYFKAAACSAEKAGDLKMAEHWLRQAIEQRSTQGVPWEPDDFASMVRLGELLRDQGRMDEAAPLLAGAYEGLAEQAGPQHDMTLGAARALVSIYIQQSQFGPASELMATTLSQVQQRSGIQSTSWIAAANTQSILLAKVGKFDDAIALNEQALGVAQALLGRRHSFTLTLLANLGIRHKDRGNLEQALTTMRTALEQTQAALGPEHRLTLSNQTNLAEVFLLLGRVEEGQTMANEALAQATLHLGATHGVTAGALEIAGLAQLDAGEPRSAVKTFEQALAIHQSQGARPLNVLTTELRYCRALVESGANEAAVARLSQLREELAQRLDSNHPLLAQADNLWSKIRPDQ